MASSFQGWETSWNQPASVPHVWIILNIFDGAKTGGSGSFGKGSIQSHGLLPRRAVRRRLARKLTARISVGTPGHPSALFQRYLIFAAKRAGKGSLRSVLERIGDGPTRCSPWAGRCRAICSKSFASVPPWSPNSCAIWISFSARYPCAVKISAGKINAVSGEAWTAELQSETQDYVVVPGQPWLDGFSVGEGLIRQFVALPLGAGYSDRGATHRAGTLGQLRKSP